MSSKKHKTVAVKPAITNKADSVAIDCVRSDIRHMIREGGCRWTCARLECRPDEIKQHCLKMLSDRTFWRRPVITESLVLSLIDQEFQACINAKMLPSDWLTRPSEKQIVWGW